MYDDYIVKAKDIKRINKNYDKYKKLLEKETDLVKQLEYKRLLREVEYKKMDIDFQILNISISHKGGELHKKIFIDRFINSVPIERLVDKYGIGRSTLYRILNKAIELFESDIWYI